MKKDITGHTRLLCLLGDPVSHSISPAMHNLSFQTLGLDMVYLAFPCSAEQFASTVSTLKQIGAKGFNCTMPCKRIAAELCQELSPAAELMNAVNTVVIENGRLIGHNTDGIGFMRSAAEAGHHMTGKQMTLLGSGGAASAILAQAALDGVKAIHLFARKGNSWNLIEKEAEAVCRTTSCRVFFNELQDETALKRAVADSALLANASSVGMTPMEDDCLIPDASYLHPELVVSDVIYHPKKTKLLAMAERAGLSTFNGMYMLLYQGAEAFRLWTGLDMPVELVKKELFS